MTPRLFCSLLVVLSTSLASQAQDRRTLEISETDTVLLNPTSIEYVVSTNTTPNFMEAIGQNKKGLSGSEVAPASMETVMTSLRNHHISWETSKAKGYSIGRNNMMGDSPITITVHSETELRSVYALLAPLSGITASIGGIEYGPMPDRLSIYKTLYQRAVAEATGMAAISGKTLGDLVSVEEPQDPLWSIRQMMDGMQPAVNLFAELSGNQRARLQRKEEIKILFKFELK